MENDWDANIFLVQLPPTVNTSGAYVHFVPYHVKPPPPSIPDFPSMMWTQAQHVGDNNRRVAFQMDWVDYCINERRTCAMDQAALLRYCVTLVVLES